MTAADLDTMTPLQRLLVERALVLATDLKEAAGAAPDGQVIDRCEALLLDRGREFLRRALEEALRDRVEALEKKRPAGPAAAGRLAAPRGDRRGRSRRRWADRPCCGTTSPARAEARAAPTATAGSASTNS